MSDFTPGRVFTSEQTMSDAQQLLADYARNGSEASFRELVTRYVDLVYSTALRSVNGDSHRAQDVTQTVFMDLAGLAPKLEANSMLGGWLHRHTCFTASKVMRGERRRQIRERQAVEMDALNNDDHQMEKLAPVLDEAINELGEEDRKAILLRFYERCDLRSVGQALATSEDAAQKRVARALERLQAILTRNGVALSAAALGTFLAGEAVSAAPAGLAMGIVGGVLAGAAASESLTLTTITWFNVKTAATILGLAALALAGTSFIKQRQVAHLRIANQTLAAQLETQNAQPQSVPGLTPIERGELEQLTTNTDELLRLRNEVGQLRQEQQAGLISLSNTNSVFVQKTIWDRYSEVFARDLRGQQLAEAFAQVMTNHSPVALIRLSPAQRPGRPPVGGRPSGIRLPEYGSVSMGAFLGQVLRYAYDLDPQFPQNRIIVPSDLAYARFDYIDTMLQGGREVLQQAIKEQFGVVARKEMRGNLVLTVKNPDAGLHKHSEANGDGAANFKSHNVTMSELAKGLAKYLGVKVTDQTGLTGGFDYSLDMPYPPTPDDIRKAVQDQLGLQLTPAKDGEQFEFLVAEKQS